MTDRDIEIIEKIVSGELSDQERVRELRRFEFEAPECWSVLAKAFVEKQMLREVFAEMEEESTSMEAGLKLVSGEPSESVKSRSWVLGLASAAVLAIGMMLGAMFGGAGVDAMGDEVIVDSSLNKNEEVEGEGIEMVSDETATAYVATYLENGDQLVVPISYYYKAE